MREGGILLPIFSLPSPFGIGALSKEAYDFVDFLYEAGQGFWQILPVGPTGFGNSPYQPFSAFAGNPYFISLSDLVEEGLLTWDEINSFHFGDRQDKVDYGTMYESRAKVLKLAFDRFMTKEDEKEDFASYCKKEKFWLNDYALYMTIKDLHEGQSWLDWEDKYRLRDAKALAAVEKEYAEKIDFYRFRQYVFDKQWRKLHAYAKKKNVKIIGDLPLYVSMDSSDAWSHPDVFAMDADRMPTMVTGCPPDAFSPTGQLWGNPAYDWKAQKADGYSWWGERIRRNYEWYDVIRLDHFHGFCEYYGIPYGSETAEKGKSFEGPGMDLFDDLEKKLGKLNMIAEDLGTNTPENEKLLKDSGFPGMKILQYAFTSWDSIYLNHRHSNNSVVYTGTHDNIPTRAWVEEINEGQMAFTRRYVNSMNTDYGALVWDIIREAYRSVADLCVIPMYDYLCIGKEARLNTPGTGDGNWEWRLQPNTLSGDLAKSIRLLSDTYGRIPKEIKPKEDKTEEKEEKE